MKKATQKAFSIFWTSTVFLFAIVPTAYAIPDDGNRGNCGGTEGLINPLRNICSFEQFVELLLQAVIRIGLPIAVLFIVYSGFLFVTAQGNAEKLQKAKNTFFYTVIGVTIFLGSWALALIVESTIRLLGA